MRVKIELIPENKPGELEYHPHAILCARELFGPIPDPEFKESIINAVAGQMLRDDKMNLEVKLL